MLSFLPGELFYILEHNEYTVYKVLRSEGETFLVSAFWPTDVLPTIEKSAAWELRTSCTALDITDLTEITAIGKQTVSAQEQEEIERFLTIQAGLQQRARQFSALMTEATTCIDQNNYRRAIELLTEAAPFSKYSMEVYSKRGFCYLQEKQFPEAIGDFEYVLSVGDSDSTVIAWCAEAYTAYGKPEKATALLERNAN